MQGWVMYFWVNISWFLINTRVYLAFSSANWFHCTCFPVCYDCLVLKKKFINCSLISYVFLACWFGFLKICEEKKPSVFLVGFYFNWTIQMMLRGWGLCNMSSCKFIEISLITQNLLNGIFHVYLFVCLLILPSFSFGTNGPTRLYIC